MKLTINQFNQTQGVVVEFPCEIKGRNGAGKSTVIRALNYVLCEKDPYPQEGYKDDYSGCYSENAITPEQLFISVELEHNGTVLRRESRPTSAQLKQFYESKNQTFSVENSFFVDNIRCAKATDYQAIIAEMFGNIPMLLSASNFFKMKANEKLTFICEIFGLSEVKNNSETLKLAKSNTNAQLTKLQVAVEIDTVRVSERQKFRLDLAEKLEVLEKLKENTPILTTQEIEQNNEILRQISERENAQPILLQRKEVVDISEISRLRQVNLNLEQANLNFETKIAQNIEKINFAETNASKIAELAALEAEFSLIPAFSSFEEYIKFREANEPITVVFSEKMKTEKYKEIEQNISKYRNIVENYEVLLKSTTCTVCGVCSLKDCDKRQISLFEKKYYENEILGMNKALVDLEAQIVKEEIEAILRLQSDAHHATLREKTEELIAKRSEIKSIPNARELAEMNEKFKSEISRNLAIIEQNNVKISELSVSEQKNAQIEQENAQIDEKNSQITKQFKEENEREITALKSKMNVVKVSENSEAIKAIEVEIAELRKNVGALELSESELKKNQELSAELYSKFAEINTKLIQEQNLFLSELTNLEVKLNEKLVPFGFVCSLSSITKGGEPICEFRLKFMGEKYQSEAYRLLRNAKFCEMLASILNSDLPIFVDESQKIVNDEILSEMKNIKNICLISADKNYSQLTINKI